MTQMTFLPTSLSFATHLWSEPEAKMPNPAVKRDCANKPSRSPLLLRWAQPDRTCRTPFATTLFRDLPMSFLAWSCIAKLIAWRFRSKTSRHKQLRCPASHPMRSHRHSKRPRKTPLLFVSAFQSPFRAQPIIPAESAKARPR